MKNKTIVLGLVGEIAAGKGTVASYLLKKYKFFYYKLSAPGRDILTRIHKEVSRRNMNALNTALRGAFGEDYLSGVIIKDITKDKCRLAIIDGIRKPAEVKFFRQIDGFKLAYITAQEKIRWKRLVTREENSGDKKKSFRQFQRDHLLATETDIDRIGRKADFKIDNSGSIEELHKNIDNIIKVIA